MTDANQALTRDAAIEIGRAAAPLNLRWLEEPLRVDAPPVDWRALADVSPIPLAGGENLRGSDLDEAVADTVLSVIQPDATKWGGISGNIAVARCCRQGKTVYVFGGGSRSSPRCICSPRPGRGAAGIRLPPMRRRELIVGSLLPVTEGRVPVPQEPGLGVVPDLAQLDRYRTWPPRG